MSFRSSAGLSRSYVALDLLISRTRETAHVYVVRFKTGRTAMETNDMIKRNFVRGSKRRTQNIRVVFSGEKCNDFL
jgi:hypothetical protein